jgi:ubiquinone/menaquinone biosynthesis C-methylase UbiE
MTESMVNAEFADVDRAGEPESFVRHLDQLTASEQVQASKRRSFARLQVTHGSTVLDVGCGTGDDARALAELVAPGGHVVGVDRSQTMVEEALRRASGLGLSLDYQVADAAALPFPDDRFDAGHIDRVLHHLPDPAPVVAELVRVVHHGGRIAIHEPDFETLVLSGGDQVVTRKVANYFCDSHGNAWAGRQLYGLAVQAGVAGVAVEPETWMFTRYADAQRTLRLEATVARATESGVLDAQEAQAWLDALRAADSAGTFFMAATSFAMSGRKP